MKNEIRSETTRQRILLAGAALFSEYGYDAAGVAQICKAAAVSKGAFYHHFESKNAMFVTLLEVWLTDLDAMLERITLAGGSFPEILSSMAQAMDGIFLQFHSQISILFEFWRQAGRDPKVWNAVMAPFQRYEKIFTGLIEKGMDEGSIGKMDPQAGANMIISLAVGLLLQGMLFSKTSQGSPALFDFESGEPAQKSIAILLDGFRRLK